MLKMLPLLLLPLLSFTDLCKESLSEMKNDFLRKPIRGLQKSIAKLPKMRLRSVEKIWRQKIGKSVNGGAEFHKNIYSSPNGSYIISFSSRNTTRVYKKGDENNPVVIEGEGKYLRRGVLAVSNNFFVLENEKKGVLFVYDMNGEKHVRYWIGKSDRLTGVFLAKRDSVLVFTTLDYVKVYNFKEKVEWNYQDTGLKLSLALEEALKPRSRWFKGPSSITTSSLSPDEGTLFLGYRNDFSQKSILISVSIDYEKESLTGLSGLYIFNRPYIYSIDPRASTKSANIYLGDYYDRDKIPHDLINIETSIETPNLPLKIK